MLAAFGGMEEWEKLSWLPLSWKQLKLRTTSSQSNVVSRSNAIEASQSKSVRAEVGFLFHFIYPLGLEHAFHSRYVTGKNNLSNTWPMLLRLNDTPLVI
jgi:hypothetical protein